jgi:hypothetical protein
VLSCDYCGKTIVGKADSYTRGSEMRHFCPGTPCMNEFLLERLKDEAERKAQQHYKKEHDLIYKQVCPACRWRLRKLL